MTVGWPHVMTDELVCPWRRRSTVWRARCAGLKTNMSPAMLRIVGISSCISNKSRQYCLLIFAPGSTKMRMVQPTFDTATKIIGPNGLAESGTVERVRSLDGSTDFTLFDCQRCVHPIISWVHLGSHGEQFLVTENKLSAWLWELVQLQLRTLKTAQLIRCCPLLIFLTSSDFPKWIGHSCGGQLYKLLMSIFSVFHKPACSH